MPDNISFDFMPTCIGSVPFTDVESTCKGIVSMLPDIPFWPQFVNISPLENMIIQYTEGLLFIDVDREKGDVHVVEKDLESRLVEFYEHVFSEDLEYFAITEDYARGLYAMMETLSTAPGGPFIKGQTVGPVTFASSITGPDNVAAINDPNISDALIKGISIKALWQAKKLSESGRKPILFLDEPSLSSVGSAFSSIQRESAIYMLKEVIDYLKKMDDLLIGIHCCGNTDWSIVTEAGPHIVNFDAYEFMDNFLLYPDEIVRFLENDGILAWGMVPTSTLTSDETVDHLFQKLKHGLKRIVEWGVSPESIMQRSMLTPACGMGSMTPELADMCMDLLTGLASICKDRDKLFS